MTINRPFSLQRGSIIRSSKYDYHIEEAISQQGAQGESYAATQRSYSDPQANATRVFIKIPRVEEGLLGEEVRERMQRIHMALSAEFENKYRFQHIDNVAKVLDLTLFHIDDPENELSVAVPCLVQEFVAGQPFAQYLDERFRTGLTQAFRGIPRQREWFQLARRLTEILRRIHNRHIVHGDIWIDNILIQDKPESGPQPWLIDFGQSFLVDQSYYRESYTDKTRPYWAPERKQSSWYSPADIYSIGGVFFYMATGQHPPIVQRGDTEQKELKELVQQTILDANPSLFRENPGIAKIIDKCLRYDPAERYQHPESLLEMLHIFDYEASEVPSAEGDIESALVEIKEKSKGLVSQSHSLFVNIVQSELKKLSRELDCMLRGHHEIFGEREELINNLLRYLSVLQPGDEYLTVTVPHYWSANNLGVNGRFLTMNVLMASRGIRIARVFLLTAEDSLRPEVIEILEAHQRAMLAVSKTNPDANFETLYVQVTEEERSGRIERGEHVAIWRRTANSDETVLSIGFTTTPRSRLSDPSAAEAISKVRFWSATRQRSILAEMTRRIEAGRPISEFLAASPPLSADAGSRMPR